MKRRPLCETKLPPSVGALRANLYPCQCLNTLRRGLSRGAMSEPRVAGLNHVTLAVADLERSVSFYQDTLGFRLRAMWDDGAYLDAGALWLCLSLDQNAKHARRDDYTHLALDVAAPQFEALAAQVRTTAPIWKENRSEGASLYFLDPDGHKLELHVGSLASRLQHYRDHPVNGRTLIN